MFLQGGARPPTPVIADFIQSDKDNFVEGRKLGVELIWSVSQVAPSTYYVARDPAPSAKTLSEELIGAELFRLLVENRKVYGVQKLKKAARRAGVSIGRDQAALLMRSRGIEGVRPSKRVKTTKLDPTAARHPDLVKRDFAATAPNQLWVTDLTFVPT